MIAKQKEKGGWERGDRGGMGRRYMGERLKEPFSQLWSAAIICHSLLQRCALSSESERVRESEVVFFFFQRKDSVSKAKERETNARSKEDMKLSTNASKFH